MYNIVSFLVSSFGGCDIVSHVCNITRSHFIIALCICLRSRSVCGLELWNEVLRVSPVCPIFSKAATQEAARKANAQKRTAETAPTVAASDKTRARVSQEKSVGSSNEQKELIPDVRDVISVCTSFLWCLILVESFKCMIDFCFQVLIFASPFLTFGKYFIEICIAICLNWDCCLGLWKDAPHCRPGCATSTTRFYSFYSRHTPAVVSSRQTKGGPISMGILRYRLQISHVLCSLFH